MMLVSGHPFIVRLALYNVANMNITLTQTLQDTTTLSIYADHLRRQILIFTQQSELADAMKDVVYKDSAKLSTRNQFK